MDIRYQVSPTGPRTPHDEVVAIPESFGGSSYNLVEVETALLGKVVRSADGRGWNIEVDGYIAHGFSTRRDATLAVLAVHRAVYDNE